MLAALDLAQETGTSLYDSLYLALGVTVEAQVVTADRKFYQALLTTSYRNQLRWIDEF